MGSKPYGEFVRQEMYMSQFTALSEALVQLPSPQAARDLRQAVQDTIAWEGRVGRCVGPRLDVVWKELLGTMLFDPNRKEPWPEGVQQQVVSIIQLILEWCPATDPVLFCCVTKMLLDILSDNKDAQAVRDISEELKIETLSCLATLVRRPREAVRDVAYSRRLRGLLGHAVYLSLKMVHKEKNRTLRLQAINTLLALGQEEEFRSLSPQEQCQISDTFVNFLPGIVVALAKVATGDENQGSKIIAAAVDAWSFFVMVVMRDSFLEPLVPHLGESDSLVHLREKLGGDGGEGGVDKGPLPKKEEEKTEEADNRNRPPDVKVSREWIKRTGDNISLLASWLVALVTHHHWRVRLSLAHWARRLVCASPRSLHGCLNYALEVLVTLQSDEMPDVARAAQAALLEIGEVLLGTGGGPGSPGSVLEEAVFKLSTQLPTTCRQEEDTRTLRAVQQLVGCLEVLGARTDHLLTCPSRSHRLLHALLVALTLDTTDSDLLLEKTIAQDPFEAITIKPRLGRSFRYFQNLRIFEALGSVCRLLGRHGELVRVAHLCVGLLQQAPHLRKEVLLLLALVLKGRARGDTTEESEEREHVTRFVLEEVLSEEVLGVPLTTDTIHTTAPTPEDLVAPLRSNPPAPQLTQATPSVDTVKGNVVLVANALSVVGSCAGLMGASFTAFLSDVLCPVMEKAGEGNILVGHSAITTLGDIARACRYPDTAALIRGTVPHFWYPLSMRLKRLPQYPTSPLVLQVALEHAGEEVAPFTEELVEEALVSLDAHHAQGAISVLRVLLAYVSAIAKREGGAPANTASIIAKVSPPEEADQSSGVGAVAKFLEDYHRTKMEVKEGLEEDGETSSPPSPRNPSPLPSSSPKTCAAPPPEPEEEAGKSVPRWVELVVEVLHRCSHLLHLEHHRTKLLLLALAGEGCRALGGWEEQRLPAVHKLWGPLLLRLGDRDLVVAGRALGTLVGLVGHSGDFLRRRVLTEALPRLLTLLEHQSSTSAGKDRRSGYYLTPEYKAQSAILRHLPALLAALQLGVKEAGEVVGAVALYAHDLQPPELCHAAVGVLRVVALTHPHHVWLALALRQPPSKLVHPSPRLQPIRIRGSSHQKLPTEALELYRELS